MLNDGLSFFNKRVTSEHRLLLFLDLVKVVENQLLVTSLRRVRLAIVLVWVIFVHRFYRLSIRRFRKVNACRLLGVEVQLSLRIVLDLVYKPATLLVVQIS